MINTLWNFTSLMKRDSKIYSIGGYGIAGGISMNFAKVVAPVAILFIIVGWIISLIFGINMFNPLKPNWNYTYLLVFLGLGVGTGFGLWNIQFTGYRLYEYLLAYIKPKRVYTNEFNANKRIFKFTNVKIKAFIRNIL